jgi:hypothetical protein
MMAGNLTIPFSMTHKHSSALFRSPLPRTTGTSFFIAISLARILSPKRDNTSGLGPTHDMPQSSSEFANGADSERKPYPDVSSF